MLFYKNLENEKLLLKKKDFILRDFKDLRRFYKKKISKN